MRRRAAGPQPKRLPKIGLGQIEPLGAIVWKPRRGKRHVHPGPAHERVNIVGIEFERAVEMRPGA